ncbi:response regulator transcription factor [Dyella nitratireducens]|uniref:DNA-binding response regulator n=1 Tax=Dyella nitratireducens TaxID=1849580 RepID=A0ABQ1GUG2_9GAMM|nr:response regulator transcription factor [Dyella nitratireducens]GGA50674.1 DNA-binding response regulator [Dyella nitratireducens]GLQ42623.1 DNA-binding response regulator [Dyella nitratireducens]
MRCLLIEDDVQTARFIRDGLLRSGHEVTLCSDGANGLQQAGNGAWDVIVLDRMLPGGIDGLAVLATLRAQDNHAPVLVLSALAGLDERVRGLREGCDDYLTKPFAFEELLARIEALGRRASVAANPSVLNVADLSVDTRTRRAYRDGKPIALQPREYQLLEYLVRYQGEVITRKRLLAAVWGYHFDPETNVIDVQMSRLRNKVDRDFPIALIHTVRGVGYTVQPLDETSHD